MDDDTLRLTDILTTASSVASYLGEREVLPRHLLDAIAILAGEKAIEDLGRPMNPLMGRSLGAASGADPRVRELAQRWFATLGADVTATLSPAQLATLIAEVEALEG